MRDHELEHGLRLLVLARVGLDARLDVVWIVERGWRRGARCGSNAQEAGLKDGSEV
jgi:hypothetical protein